MKFYRPTTKSRRHMSTVSYRGVLTASEPTKSLTRGRKRNMGRNSQGKLTTEHKGGGHKRLFRDIDFRYEKKDVPGRVETVEYDPNRTGFIGRVLFADGDRRYVLLPRGISVGAQIIVSEKAPLSPGNRLPIRNIPIGSFIYNIELKPGGGAVIARSAGNYAQLIALDQGQAHLKLPSTEVRKVSADAWASLERFPMKKIIW